MAKGYFGQFLDKFKFTDPRDEESLSNQIAIDTNDGAIQVNPDSMSQYAISLDWSYNSQAQLIETYREVANYNLVDFAIEDITNEMVSFSEDEEPISLDLSNIETTDLSDSLKDKFYEAYDKVTTLLDLKQTVHRRAKQFYIDGRLAYQKVIDQKKPANGLVNVVELDTRFVTKIRQVQYDQENKVITGVQESFVYDETVGRERKTQETNKASQFKTVLELNPNSIVYVTSGLTDPKTGYAISWLHKAVKPANQLRMMENALVIYRIVRAPERRLFYVDTSNMPKTKAEEYLRALKNNYRNRMSFDPETGLFKDDRHLQTMQEDFWLPRNSNGRGSEVNTLPGGQNLSEIEDVLYFQKQLYKALNIPISRLETDSMMALGRQAEISRDELKFSRFVSKIRKRFNMMLLDLLKTELILTKVITVKEWSEIEQKIEFKYALDQYIEETRHSEMLRDRIDLANQLEPYVGKYVSHDYVRKEVLRQSESDIEDQDKKISEEKTNKQFSSEDDEDNEAGGGGRRF